MQHVFISYIRKNKGEVDRLYNELTSRGIEVWLDRRDLGAGARWKREIKKAISDGAFFIACFSKEYHERAKTYMNAELRIAIEQMYQLHIDRKWFIPIRLDDCEIPDMDIGGSETLRDLHHVDLYEDWNAGIQSIVKVIQPDPPELDSAEEYNERGDAYHGKKEFDKAIKDYTEAIKLEPDNAATYNKLGNSCKDKGEFTLALYNYNRAIELDPEFPNAYNGRGIVYGEMGNLDQAIKDYKTAIEIDPTYATPYNSLGKVYREKGEYNLAIKNYDKAIELNPDSAFLYLIYNNRGVAYRRKGEVDQAIEDFTKAIELKPDFDWAYSNRGNAYKDKGEFDRALEEHTKAIEVNPDYSDAYRNRGNVYFHKGDFERAIEEYDKAIERDPKNVEAYCNRGETLLHLQEWKGAKANLETAKGMKADVIGSFHNQYKNVEDFEQKTGIQLPEDITALLTQPTDKEGE